MVSGATLAKLLLAVVVALSGIHRGLGDTLLQLLQSQPELSQAAQYFQSTDYFNKVSEAGGTVFAPSNNAFNAFVDHWRGEGLGISGFSDIPQQTQEQILEYHLTFTTWTPQALCGQEWTDDNTNMQKLSLTYTNAYTPVGPDNTVGSFQASAKVTENWNDPDANTCINYCSPIFCEQPQPFEYKDMTFTVSDDYTGYKADFTFNNVLTSDNLVAYPIETVLIPNVALQTLEQMAGASDEFEVVAEGPAQAQPLWDIM